MYSGSFGLRRVLSGDSLGFPCGVFSFDCQIIFHPVKEHFDSGDPSVLIKVIGFSKARRKPFVSGFVIVKKIIIKTSIEELFF